MSGVFVSPKDFLGFDYVLYYNYRFDRLGESSYGNSHCSCTLNKDGVAFAVTTFSYSGDVEGASAIRAIYEGLKLLPKDRSVGILVHNSKLQMALTSWLPRWIKNDFVNMDSSVVPNSDLWRDVWSILEDLDYKVLFLRNYESVGSGSLCCDLVSR